MARNEPGTAPLRFAVAASTHPAQFEAIAYKGELESTVAELAALGFDGVELAIRDPSLVRSDELVDMIERHALAVPAISTGQAYAEEGLCLHERDPEVRRPPALASSATSRWRRAWTRW